MDGERRRRVLLIDDDSVVRDVLRDIVTALGYAADIAGSGEEGISLFAKYRYDVILTDLRMPGMTGWEVLAAVRALDPRIPVIIVTGSHVHPDDDRVAHPGVALVKKPVEAGALEDALSRVLNRSLGAPGTHVDNFRPER